MPISIVDLEDAKLLGTLNFREFQKVWLADWLRPLMQIVVAKRDERTLVEWDKLPPELMETMQQDHPDEFAEASAAIKEMRKQFK